MLCGRLPLIVLFFLPAFFLVRRLPSVWPCSAEAFEFADPLTLPWHPSCSTNDAICADDYHEAGAASDRLAARAPRAVRAGMRSLPKGIDPADLPDLAHYRGHGIDRINGW